MPIERKIIATICLAFVLQTGAYSLDFGSSVSAVKSSASSFATDGAGDILNKYKNASSFLDGGSFFESGFNIPGIVGGQLTCEFNEFELPSVADICDATYGAAVSKATEKIDNILDSLTSFALGPCKINTDIRKTCRNDQIQNLCSRLRNKEHKIKPEFTPEVVANEAIEQLIFTGGDVYFKHDGDSTDVCSAATPSKIWEKAKYGSHSSAQIFNEKLGADATVAKLGYDSLFKPLKFDLYASCIKQMALAGHENPEELCEFGKADYTYGLKDTSLEAKESIALAVQNNFTDPMANQNTKNSSIENYLKTQYLLECDSSQVGFDIAACENSVYENTKVSTTIGGVEKDVPIIVEQNDVLKRIEENTGVYSATVQIATTPEYKISHPTRAALMKVSPESRLKYLNLAQKQMAQDTLMNSYSAKMSGLKKELAKINYQKNKIAAKPFYSKQAKAKAQAIMEIGLEK